jgi:hypothetical protein
LEKFSVINKSIQTFSDDVSNKAELQAVEAWPTKERTENKRLARIVRAEKNFWDFDKFYFTPNMYSDGYAKPCNMHRELVRQFDIPGVHIDLAPRKHGKTVTLKKASIWQFLTGQLDVGMVFSESLYPNATDMLKDIAELIKENERILHDYNPVFKESNAEQFQFRTMAKGTEHFWRYCAAFSEGRSTRGYIRKFNRPLKGYGDDIETLTSSFGKEPVKKRIELIGEAFSTLRDNGTIIVAGNDVDRRGAMHQLRIEQEEGVIARHWHVNVWKAWSKKPLWKARYPATNESQIKLMLKPRNEADYQTTFQMNPTLPEGTFFKLREFHYIDEIPRDARGVVYVDPNLAKKKQGDTTAMTVLLWSPSLLKKIVARVRCKSFSESNELLDIALALRLTIPGVRAIGFDGNVNQESAWTNNIRNWCRIKKAPFPRVHYYRFHVDDLAKNTQADWKDDNFVFMRNIFNDDEGHEWLMQVLAFDGKKANKTDDAPDSFICADEMLNQLHLCKRKGDQIIRPSISINANYSF